jgi:hypothetical protein
VHFSRLQAVSECFLQTLIQKSSAQEHFTAAFGYGLSPKVFVFVFFSLLGYRNFGEFDPKNK